LGRKMGKIKGFMAKFQIVSLELQIAENSFKSFL